MATLTEEQNGLRFDIYERVHLAEGAAGIRDLDDVELIPSIEVIPQQEQALLKGSLLLNGSYLDEQDTKRSLEHSIPVEITLPLSRVQRIEDILVDIETFDVDVLNSRSLNVTGVLSLHGVEMAYEAGGWSEEDEEVVFVHEAASAPQNAPAEQWSEPAGGADELELRQQTEYSASADGQAKLQPPTTSAQPQYQAQPQAPVYPGSAYKAENPWLRETRTEQPEVQAAAPSAWDRLATPKSPPPQEDSSASYADRSFGELTLHQLSSERSYRSAGVEEAQEQRSPSAAAGQQPLAQAADPASASREEQEAAGQAEREETAPAFSVDAEVIEPERDPVPASAPAQESLEVFADEEPAVQEETKELKVAFGSKKQQDSPSSGGSGLQSLFANGAGSSASSYEHTEKDEREYALASGSEESKADALEWKKLFIQTEKEDQQFRKVTMCIVQKEDSLDLIAKRYEINPRELQLYNRLEDQEVSPGQVLYIPGKAVFSSSDQ
ncbi:LysM peptidoglycan-binding domain-containing protein [Paenibacillus chitinolyticus]|uniref:LysM peptidoglycan-binding domain-containing protein n=1 Tax=Paenibacillus chitinolyticus TaxID=79263 RepID=A0ABT4FG44_9BACL|nr:LysM peptidoglycan-binding domain-containing protein [Paenibacillus chitinolyticus]MCY9593512.1 LysM peptidoglycan-binding domain-containing protein [Paenibacillus chitinolyticus]MCY9597483.1 LysM peptidoglycan-binding domain-containing protein [Paenibacillus chitinolyticus]